MDNPKGDGTLTPKRSKRIQARIAAKAKERRGEELYGDDLDRALDDLFAREEQGKESDNKDLDEQEEQRGAAAAVMPGRKRRRSKSTEKRKEIVIDDDDDDNDEDVVYEHDDEQEDEGATGKSKRKSESKKGKDAKMSKKEKMEKQREQEEKQRMQKRQQLIRYMRKEEEELEDPLKDLDPKDPFFQRLAKAEKDLENYWNRSFENDDTIDRIRKGEEEVMKKRKQLPYFAELVGVDRGTGTNNHTRKKWVYQLKNPLVESYINIGRSHDNYMYPLHVDLAEAARANIISRLHASVRFNLEKAQWEVQVFGRNGVEFPAWGWCLPADYDDEVWRALRSVTNNRFVIGEVEFEIRRNPIFSSDRAMVEACRQLAGVAEREPMCKSEGIDHMEDVIDALESAEEDEDGKDPDLLATLGPQPTVMSAPPRGTTGQRNPEEVVIEDEDELEFFTLVRKFPPPQPPSPRLTVAQLRSMQEEGMKLEQQKNPQAPRESVPVFSLHHIQLLQQHLTQMKAQTQPPDGQPAEDGGAGGTATSAAATAAASANASAAATSSQPQAQQSEVKKARVSSGDVAVVDAGDEANKANKSARTSSVKKEVKKENGNDDVDAKK